MLISLPLLPLRKLGRVPGGRTEGRSSGRPAVVAWHLPLRLRRRSQFGRPKAANDIAGAASVLARPRSLGEPLRSLHSILLSASSNVLPPFLPWSPCTSLAWLSPPISRPGLKMKRGPPFSDDHLSPVAAVATDACLPLPPPPPIRERTPYLWIADTIKNGRILFLGVIDTIMEGRHDRQAASNVTAAPRRIRRRRRRKHDMVFKIEFLSLPAAMTSTSANAIRSKTDKEGPGCRRHGMDLVSIFVKLDPL